VVEPGNGEAQGHAVAGLDHSYSAQIAHIAGQADAASRMVQVTARVDDPERQSLRPGSFAQVTVPVDAGTEKPIVPQSAVRPSERGFLAYVVDNGVARERTVTLGLRTADGQAEVLTGLSPGDLLVVRGQEALAEGVQVLVEQPSVTGQAAEASKPSTGPATSTAQDDPGSSDPTRPEGESKGRRESRRPAGERAP
jgi:RND family efflux transporter MFP subunit